MNDWNISPDAARLHRDAIVWDSLLPWLKYGSSELRAATLPMMITSGYTFVSLTVVLDGESVEETVRGIAENRAFFRAHAEQFILVESVDDVLRAKREGKLAVGFNFQGTESIGRDINLVEVYCKLGVRQMLMAYNQGNAVGGGCHERVDAGLTRFGVELVQEMNRVGVLVDVSHTGYRTSMDVFEVSPGPVIFSHSNPYALFEHGRNIRDDQIKACARSGGVIGIVGCDQFMVDAGPTTEGLLNMIDYHAEVAGGPQYVGIGLDYLYDPPGWLRERVLTPMNRSRYPAELGYDADLVANYATPEQLPYLTEGLLERSYSESDIRGILGDNWLRVARQVWK